MMVDEVVFCKGVHRPVQLCVVCKRLRVKRGMQVCSFCSKEKNKNRRLGDYGY